MAYLITYLLVTSETIRYNNNASYVGGGGFYGGGAGRSEGGGGGSSFLNSSYAAVVTNAQGVNIGSGAVSITATRCSTGSNCCSAGYYLVNNMCTACTADTYSRRRTCPSSP
jgi:hypothetical protein